MLFRLQVLSVFHCPGDGALWLRNSCVTRESLNWHEKDWQDLAVLSPIVSILVATQVVRGATSKVSTEFSTCAHHKCILAANFIVTTDFEGSRLRSLVHPYPRQTDEILDNLKAGTSVLLTLGKFFGSLAAALRLSYSFFLTPSLFAEHTFILT